MRLLLVEDDPDLARSLKRGLSEASYAVDVAMNGTDALERAGFNTYDAIILDVMIPAPDGIQVCQQLRADRSDVPILMLTARDTVEDRVAGLDSGADDYLVKPFDFGELLARVRALIRRGGAQELPVLEVGDLRIDTRSRRVSRGGDSLTLTTKEYALLEFLARNAGRVVGREEISEHVWNESFDPFSNLIEVYVNRLRRAVDRSSPRKLIHTIRGAGYVLEDRPA